MPFRFTFKDWRKCRDNMVQAILSLLCEITSIVKPTPNMNNLFEQVTRWIASNKISQLILTTPYVRNSMAISDRMPRILEKGDYSGYKECAAGVFLESHTIKVCFRSNALLDKKGLEHLGLFSQPFTGTGSWDASIALLFESECSRVWIRRSEFFCFPCTNSFNTSTTGKRRWSTAYQGAFAEVTAQFIQCYIGRAAMVSSQTAAL